MNFIKQIERLQLLNKLILQERTGPPEELAHRLHVSRRTIYDLIDILKDWGAEVAYDRKNRTFYYKLSFEVNIYFSLKVIKEGESEKIYGGSLNFFLPCISSARKDFSLAYN